MTDETTDSTGSIHASALARLRRSIRKHVGDGWIRAVFARPRLGAEEGEADAVVVPGSGTTPSPAEVDALVGRAEAAAREGLVKQTFVLDEQTRVRIDARHGRAKVQRLDEATLTKMMGGKDRPLRPDRSAELLRVIGIMNPDGSISAKHAKKYKQVNHFVEICRPIWDGIDASREDTEPIRILDLGCGNGYLDFVMAEALRLRGTPARIHGVDVREDVVKRGTQRAETLGWAHVTFARASIEETHGLDAELGGAPDLVVALHACDTATDDALALAVRVGAGAILVAPCCQHELAGQLSDDVAGLPRAMLRHGLLRRDLATLLTDALRVQMLEACHYAVDMIEFVHGSHTPKNLLIRARRRDPSRSVDPTRWKLQAVRDRCADLGVVPRLLQSLTELAENDDSFPVRP
jgi:SAM-dependent methyltransferase